MHAPWRLQGTVNCSASQWGIELVGAAATTGHGWTLPMFVTNRGGKDFVRRGRLGCVWSLTEMKVFFTYSLNANAVCSESLICQVHWQCCARLSDWRATADGTESGCVDADGTLEKPPSPSLESRKFSLARPSSLLPWAYEQCACAHLPVTSQDWHIFVRRRSGMCFNSSVPCANWHQRPFLHALFA